MGIVLGYFPGPGAALLNFMTRASIDGVDDISFGRIKLNSAAWGALWQVGLLNTPSECADLDSQFAALSTGLNIGPLGSLQQAWLVFS
ncbi:hypothetical protein [Corynebacterium ammoniagenes]|uniref:hypothetical protein n=1 Tax=Corynebacterium ammoniagenes TaxID=1697 RepID=UPI001F2543E0|nr:hypothetical protein [Corynebacterium ammoniagenes]